MLRYSHSANVWLQVSELQALLTLIQKATQDVSLSSLDHEDQKHIRRLIDSARGPLSQLDGLITDCLRNTKQGSSSNGRRSHVSYTNWLKLRKRVGKIRNNFLNAHHKINTALMALSNLQQYVPIATLERSISLTSLARRIANWSCMSTD